MAISNWIAGLRTYRTQAVKIFVLTAFFVHIWTIFNVLFDVPSLILYMNLGELLAAISYPLMFALFESIILALPLILLGAVIPDKLRSSLFLSFVFAFLLLATAGAVAFHMIDDLWDAKKWVLLGVVGLTGALTVTCWRFPRLRNWIDAAAERLTVLLYIYLVIDALAVIVVIVRNVL